MIVERRRGYWCSACNRPTEVRRRGVDHAAHLVLALLTVGCWLPIYGLNCLIREPWRCAWCRGAAVVDPRTLPPPPRARQSVRQPGGRNAIGADLPPEG